MHACRTYKTSLRIYYCIFIIHFIVLNIPIIAEIFPFFLNYVPLILTSGTDFYISYISEVMKARTEQGGGDRVLLLDALIDLMKNAKTKTFAEMGVNEKVILAQAWEMFLACNASVQDFFPLVLFEICGSEEAQEKVYEEILAANSGDDRSGETQLNGVKYPYLNACISEVLRLHTTFSKPERRCNKNWSYGDIRIPKGVSVVFPSNALHRNPDLWPEPDKFIPERFLQPRDEKDQLDPFKWQAFGQGQRGCIGQRVAMDLLRTFSICLFKRFRVERSAGSEKLEWSRGGVFFVAYEPFYFNFIKRG
jgi:cytochrome P450